MNRRDAAFWLGSLTVTAGVVLHLPMYWMGRNTGFVLAKMPMDGAMYAGMGLIVFGIVLAAYGLLPSSAGESRHHDPETLAPPEEAPLTRAHWLVMSALAVGMIIDIMKPASLGFVTPGMRTEYEIGSAMVAFLPLSALAGTTLGSFVWGALADVYGRRAAIMLSAVMFIGTSICGAMPSFWWGVGKAAPRQDGWPRPVMGLSGPNLPRTHVPQCRRRSRVTGELRHRADRDVAIGNGSQHVSLWVADGQEADTFVSHHGGRVLERALGRQAFYGALHHILAPWECAPAIQVTDAAIERFDAIALYLVATVQVRVSCGARSRSDRA